MNWMCFSYPIQVIKNFLFICKLILCFDLETDKSSAAMDCNVGSFADPIPGLAHVKKKLKFLLFYILHEKNSFWNT